MYNRYIPQMEDAPIDLPPQATNTERSPFSWKGLLNGGVPEGLRTLFASREGEGDPLGGLLKSLKLDGVDSGDILLVLLILYLLIEGEDQWELIITLGLLLIMGLADGGEEK